MKSQKGTAETRLDLKAGEWVEVRSREEVLSTLDERGCFENVPFMPEMLDNCGKTFRVSKRADKTCDPAHTPWTIRRLTDTVHLENGRCSGAAHGGCEAGCLIFWKEAWLKRASRQDLVELLPPATASFTRISTLITADELIAASRKQTGGQTVYFCQATEVRNFTSFMKWWDPRQYVRDIRSRNLANVPPDATRGERILDLILGILRVIQAVVVNTAWARYNIIHPSIAGQLDKTVVETLDLQPGELVQVRSKEEIVATLNRENKNRGLLFDTEMVPYCGGIYRVLRRVHHIIDEKTGVMMDMRYPCIVLEGVVCKSDFHRLCPRAIYSYWRESWLRRVSPEDVARMPAAEPAAETVEHRNAECRTACL
jgi:hypothetical protein